MSIKHNKKRNVGLVYELLIQHITSCIVEGRKSDARVGTKLIEKHFAKGKELHKEFRLFNALANATVSDTHIVASVLTEAKRAARKIDTKKLSIEKSKLIRDINYKINRKDFFYQNISNYRQLGSIQIVINEWRKESPDLGRLIEFEKKVGENLLAEKSTKTVSDMQRELDASKSDKLILKLMTEKINSKYSNLSNSEREIISNYVFYSSQNDEYLSKYLAEKRQVALDLLENFEDHESNQILIEKVDRVRNSIQKLENQDVNDESIVKFLTITKLINELKSVEKENV
jgi:hypothetical protein